MVRNSGRVSSHSFMHGGASPTPASDVLSALDDSVANHPQACTNLLSFQFIPSLEEKRHSRYDCSLRDIHCGWDSNADITDGRVVLLILNTVPT